MTLDSALNGYWFQGEHNFNMRVEMEDMTRSMDNGLLRTSTYVRFVRRNSVGWESDETSGPVILVGAVTTG